jgi:hypothetical protein
MDDKGRSGLLNKNFDIASWSGKKGWPAFLSLGQHITRHFRVTKSGGSCDLLEKSEHGVEAGLGAIFHALRQKVILPILYLFSFSLAEVASLCAFYRFSWI